uniref:Uncharacterized protein n=1 Tax=Solanum lycopersicum TaxID=4081 RepID=A0A3Q7J8S5_SOLLC
MSIIPEASFEISDENSMTSPFPVNRKRKKMNKSRGSAADKWTDEETSILISVLEDTKTFKDLLSSCSGYGWNPTTNTITCPSHIWSEHVAQKKKKKIYISKYRYHGLKDYDTLDEIFGNSFATGDHVMYSTNPNLPPKSNEVIVEEYEPFDGDDEHVATVNTCQPMSRNTGSGSGSAKRTLEPSEGGTSTRRKKRSCYKF